MTMTYETPLNARIAEALGWRVWEDPRNPGRWFQERDSKPGFIEARPVIDYIAILRVDALLGHPNGERVNPTEVKR